VDGICSTVGEQFASGMNVEEVASQRLGELVDTGQVYVTLRRLQEDRNLLHAKEVRSPNGSGHMVTVYTVTDAGRVAMDTSAAFYAAVSDRAALLREIAEASFVATPKHGVAAHGKPQSKTKKGPTRK
jgi:DNA-binding PadR family transcriptional regulator